MTVSNVRRFLTALLIATVAGCGIIEGDCVESHASAPVLSLVVRDAETGEYLAEGAQAVMVEGDFTWVLKEVPPEDGGQVEALGFYVLRDGEYDITVSHDGYETWTRNVSLFVESECFTQRPQITIPVNLVPSSS